MTDGGRCFLKFPSELFTSFMRALTKLGITKKARVDSPAISKEDVCNCYRFILGREPESDSVVAEALNHNRSFYELRANFIRSPEFRELCKTLLTEEQEQHPYLERLRPTVAFIHLLKTGGTTLHSMLEAKFPSDRIWPHHHNSLHRYSVAELGRYDLFSGHFDFHSIGYIPRSHVKTVSIFRDPSDRLISFYRFLRSHPSGREFEHNLFVHLAQRLSVEEFFEHADIRSRPEIHNHYLLVFGFAYAQATEQWPPIDKNAITASLDRAFTNVRALTAIGITENFTESAELVFRSLNIPFHGSIKNLQVTDNLAESDRRYRKVEKVHVSARLREAFSELTLYDSKIYTLALAEFRRRSALACSTRQSDELPDLSGETFRPITIAN